MSTAVDRRRRLLAIVVAAAVAVAFADSSIVVLALPSIYGSFGASIVGVSWVITSYNLVVALAAVALLPILRRVDIARVTRLGLALFGAGAIGSAAAPDLAVLIVCRCLQGAGAAMLLAGALALLAALTGSRARGVAMWTAAGTLGAAVGPALGGVLTQFLDWRAIFVVQVPLALLALVAAREPHVHVQADGSRRPRVAANVGLALVFGALVGALFLAVLLVVTVWGLSPIAGAAVVSTLPLAALAARRLARELSPRLSAGAGAGLLAAGLVALALLPATSTVVVGIALALCGAGLGLAVPSLTHAALDPEPGVVRDGTITIGARHAGLVLALALLAPLLSHDLAHGGQQALLGGTKVILEGDAPLTKKVPIALDLRAQLGSAQTGVVPDLAAPFDRQGAQHDPGLREMRDSLIATLESALTRGFRNAFALAALLALLALVPIALARRRARMTTRRGRRVLIALASVAGVLVALELAVGAIGFGRVKLEDPCSARPASHGAGVDPAVQRVALSALDGAACALHTSAEALVLSFSPAAGTHISWTPATVAEAVLGAIGQEARDNTGSGSALATLRQTLGKIAADPLGWVIQQLH
jgi:MFS family permease